MKKLIFLFLVLVLVVGGSVTALAVDKPISDYAYPFYTVENGDTYFSKIDTSNLTSTEKDFLKEFFDVMYRGKESLSSYFVSIFFNGSDAYFYFNKIDGTVTHLFNNNSPGYSTSSCYVPNTTTVKTLTFTGRFNNSGEKIFKNGKIYNSIINPYILGYNNIIFTKNFDIPKEATYFLTHTGNIYFKGDDPDIFYTPAAVQHNLTINYKYADGTQAAESTVTAFDVGAGYNVNSPVIDGYTPDLPAVTGTMGEADTVVDVTYSANIVLPTLTINYKYADGTQAAESHVEQLLENRPYSVASPAIEGYTPNIAVAEGRMTESNLTIVVTYTEKTTGGGDSGGDDDTVYDPFAPPTLDDYNGYNPFLTPSLGDFDGYNPFAPPSTSGWGKYDPFVNPSKGYEPLKDPFTFHFSDYDFFKKLGG